MESIDKTVSSIMLHLSDGVLFPNDLEKGIRNALYERTMCPQIEWKRCSDDPKVQAYYFGHYDDPVSIYAQVHFDNVDGVWKLEVKVNGQEYISVSVYHLHIAKRIANAIIRCKMFLENEDE